MEAAKLNLIINKKATFRFDFYVLATHIESLPPDDVGQTPIDLTGCSITAKAKRKIGDTTNLFTFTSSIPTPTKGHCRLELTPAQTASMVWDTGVWDVLITFPSGDIVKYLEGNLKLDKAAS